MVLRRKAAYKEANQEGWRGISFQVVEGTVGQESSMGRVERSMRIAP